MCPKLFIVAYIAQLCRFLYNGLLKEKKLFTTNNLLYNILNSLICTYVTYSPAPLPSIKFRTKSLIHTPLEILKYRTKFLIHTPLETLTVRNIFLVLTPLVKFKLRLFKASISFKVKFNTLTTSRIFSVTHKSWKAFFLK